MTSRDTAMQAEQAEQRGDFVLAMALYFNAAAAAGWEGKPERARVYQEGMERCAQADGDQAEGLFDEAEALSRAAKAETNQEVRREMLTRCGELHRQAWDKIRGALARSKMTEKAKPAAEEAPPILANASMTTTLGPLDAPDTCACGQPAKYRLREWGREGDVEDVRSVCRKCAGREPMWEPISPAQLAGEGE